MTISCKTYKDNLKIILLHSIYVDDKVLRCVIEKYNTKHDDIFIYKTFV